MYQYITIQEYYKQNGHRHLERAIAYVSAGYPDRYYEGSIKKALRNFKIAEDFNLETWQKQIVDVLQNRLYDAILYGIQITKNENGIIKYIDLKDIYIK